MIDQENGAVEPTAGYVYLLINYAMPGLAKIGRTSRAPATRVGELSSVTGVPTPFVLVYDILVPNAAEAESALHEVLSARGYRVSANREFYQAPLHEIVKLMLQLREHMESESVLTPSRKLPFAALAEDEPPAEFDPLIRQAAEACLRARAGSTSAIQRDLKIGYGRAVRIVEQLEVLGVLGPASGSEPRAILVDARQVQRLLSP